MLDAIRHAILAGELRPGQALVETDLAEVLGVSKTPVREALKTLAGAGLVTMNPYKGAAVRVVDGEQARHVYDARLLLEPEALARAVAGGHDWRPAHQALARADSARDQAERSLANRAFHRELYAGCGNPLMVRMLDDLRDQTALVTVLSWQQAPSWEHEAAQTRAILAALAQARDADLAAGLLREHIAGFATRHFAGTSRKAPNGVPMRLDPATADEFRGILATVAAIPVTPSGPDGAPDWDCHRRLIGRLLNGEITLITPNGNTGEFYTLLEAETETAVELAIRAAGGAAEVLAGVGHDVTTATRAAAHARAAGARMIMVHQPVSPYLSRTAGWTTT